METSVRSAPARIGLARLGLLAACAVLGGFAALAGFAAPLRAQAPGPEAPATERSARGPADFERWVRMLERESANPDAEIARSARAALDALGDRGQRRGEDSRADRGPRRGPDSAGERRRADGRYPSGPDFPPRPMGPRPPRDRGMGPRGRDAEPRGREASPREGLDDGPRGGPFPGERPPRCGPGCCLHGQGARDGGPPHPFPRGVPPGPPPGGPRGPRDFAPRPPRDDGPRRRPEPGFDGPRPPRPPLPDRDEPSRPHRSTSKET